MYAYPLARIHAKRKGILTGKVLMGQGGRQLQLGVSWGGELGPIFQGNGRKE